MMSQIVYIVAAQGREILWLEGECRFCLSAIIGFLEQHQLIQVDTDSAVAYADASKYIFPSHNQAKS